MAGIKAEWGVVIVAAGRGTRMGSTESKQYLLLLDKPIVVHAIERFEAMDEVAEIVVVVGAHDVKRSKALVNEYGLRKVKAVVAGGSERQHSVCQGLQALSSEWVMVHDGVRPLVTSEAVRTCMTEAKRSQAAVLAVPVKDTIKQVDEYGVIVATPDRRSLWAIQTPQAFRRSLLLESHNRAAAEGFLGTDDAVVVERFGGVPVTVSEGEYTNIKITTPDDLPYAAFLLAQRAVE